jgi:hypothetical protein
MREANHHNFGCRLLEDCCGAPDAGNPAAAVKMVKMQGGRFGAVSDNATLIAAPGRIRRRPYEVRLSLATGLIHCCIGPLQWPAPDLTQRACNSVRASLTAPGQSLWVSRQRVSCNYLASFELQHV